MAAADSYKFPGAKEAEVVQPLSIYLILMMIFQCSGCAKTTSTASVAPITNGGGSPSQKSAAPITHVGAVPAQKTQSELKVGVEPYYANRQGSTFGQDMSQKGILPVMVFLQNTGAHPLKVTLGLNCTILQFVYRPEDPYFGISTTIARIIGDLATTAGLPKSFWEPLLNKVNQKASKKDVAIEGDKINADIGNYFTEK